MRQLLALLAASIDALIELTAGMLVSGVVWRRQREVPLEFFDLGTALRSCRKTAWKSIENLFWVPVSAQTRWNQLENGI